MNKHNAKHNSQSVKPAYEEIAARAYSLFEAAGRLDGHDLEHWLLAEKQLSNSRPAGNKLEKATKAEGRQARYGRGEKIFAANALRNEREDRYAHLLKDDLRDRVSTEIVEPRD
jgi:hypothetical protein